MTLLKYCPSCQRQLPVECFSIKTTRGGPDGRTHVCKPCIAATFRARRAGHEEPKGPPIGLGSDGERSDLGPTSSPFAVASEHIDRQGRRWLMLR